MPKILKYFVASTIAAAVFIGSTTICCLARPAFNLPERLYVDSFKESLPTHFYHRINNHYYGVSLSLRESAGGGTPSLYYLRVIYSSTLRPNTGDYITIRLNSGYMLHVALSNSKKANTDDPLIHSGKKNLLLSASDVKKITTEQIVEIKLYIQGKIVSLGPVNVKLSTAG